MKPITSTPSLGSFNGFGLGIYGARDKDAETGTFVKTQVVTALFLPILALKAFRVGTAPDGGFFVLGREPLSLLAKAWNILVGLALFAVAGSIGLGKYRSTPEYIAKSHLEQAAKQEAASDPLGAASTYLKMYQGTTHRQDEAKEGLGRSLGSALDSREADLQMEAVRYFSRLPGNLKDPPVVPDLYERASTLAMSRGARDPKWALEMIEKVEFLNPDDPELGAKKRELLEKFVKESPGDLAAVVPLALAYEEDGMATEAKALLGPLEGKLENGEGARILGQVLLAEGEFERGNSILQAYVDPRVEKLKVSADQFFKVSERVYDRWLNHLQNGKAPQSFYTKLDRMSEEEASATVQKFLATKVEEDRGYTSALEAFESGNVVVPIVIDLGISQLSHARSLPDPGERQALLKKAEETFLSVGSIAGESIDYQMILGQVKHWMGKEDEANKIFDDLLEKNGRSAAILYPLAQTVRELGEDTRARSLLDEAYEKSIVEEEKQQIAQLRAISTRDLDESILWLGRAGKEDPAVQGELASLEGRKALSEGDETKALERFRASVASYQGQQRSASNLNNEALVHLQIFNLTGAPEDQKTGARLLAEAVKLSPGDSILLFNSAQINLDTAVIEMTGDELNLRPMIRNIDLSLLNRLYDNPSGRDQILTRLKSNGRFQTAVEQLEQVMVLAPKNRRAYETVAEIRGRLRDQEGLESLGKHLGTLEFDFSEESAELLTRLQGNEDPNDVSESITAIEGQIDYYEELLGDAEIKSDPTTWAALASYRLGMLQAKRMIGGEVKVSEIRARAEEIVEKKSDRASKGGLVSALFLDGLVKVAAEVPEIRAVEEKCRRDFLPMYIVTAILEADSDGAAALRSSPEIQKAFALNAELDAKFPDEPGFMSWALAKGMGANDAGEIRQAAIADKLAQAKAVISRQLNPMSTHRILESYWGARAEGDEAKASEIKRDAIEFGYPWPGN